jgi:uncharacterized iron-regulated protein
MFLTGCAGGTSSRGESATIAPRDPRGLAVFRGGDGSTAAWGDVVEAAAGAEVVLIGENHGHALGLAAAAALFEDVLAQPGVAARAALAMEFIERDEQADVDDYLSGVTDGAGFAAASRRTASNFPAGHRAMVEAARRAGRPVVAANAPRRYVRLARTAGFERLTGLGAEQRRLFRLPDVEVGGRYREEFDKLMGGNSAAMFRAQSVWDWTMAESVTRSVAKGDAPTVLVVGRFHVEFDGGTAQAVRLIRPGTRVVTVSFVDAESAALRGEDAGRADFVVYAGPFEEAGGVAGASGD